MMLVLHIRLVYCIIACLLNSSICRHLQNMGVSAKYIERVFLAF